MTFNKAETWNALTGQRTFKSGLQAWQVYGQYRFSVSQRTFLTYVGKGKTCSPRQDKLLYVEYIEFIGQSKAWAPTPSFCRGAHTGGEGEMIESEENNDVGVEIQKEKLRKARLESELLEMDVLKKRRELLPRSEYEQSLAAAAAVVGTESETFVYDNVREIIHLCKGNIEREDSLREYLLKKVRRWLHAFSVPIDYEINFMNEDASDEGSHLETIMSNDDASISY